MLTTAGDFNTPIALTDSQNSPSAVDALPMLTNVTSSPLCEKLVNFFRSFKLRYNTDAYASPTLRGICAPVGDTSAEVLYICVCGIHSPSGVRLREAKCAFI